MKWYFTAIELQFVSFTNDYHQHRLYHLLLLSHPLLLHHRHFITASLLSQPHLIAPSQPSLTTPTLYITTTVSTCAMPPPSCLHITSLHCTALPLLLQSNFYFSLLDFTLHI
jgi:hypothetical protein